MQQQFECAESRLDRMLARLSTQKRCLEFAAGAIAGVPGPVFELGLGKGRTFDHLRRLLPERALFVFDRFVHAPEDVQPDAQYLLLGDFADSLQDGRCPDGAALIHADMGSDNRAHDAEQAERLAPLIAEKLVSGGLVLCDRPLALPGCVALPLPEGCAGWPYYLYRRPQVAVGAPGKR